MFQIRPRQPWGWRVRWREVRTWGVANQWKAYGGRGVLVGGMVCLEVRCGRLFFVMYRVGLCGAVRFWLEGNIFGVWLGNA
jgi:hypothetical protein